jgi:dTDP-4-dehydrorhamnose reductase
MEHRVLIIGGSSFIGGYLAQLFPGTHRVFSTFFSHRSNITRGKAIRLDVRDSNAVKNVLDTVLPDIVYLLAYSNDDLKGTVVRGASYIMESAAHSHSRVIFLSTDAVFSGDKNRYFEHDKPDAVNDYGKAKAKAEAVVLKRGGHVVRTSLVYGFDPIDPRTRLLLTELRMGTAETGYFHDEYRCPIFAPDLCTMLGALAGIDTPRILHIAGPECISRLEFARRLAVAHGFSGKGVREGSLKESGFARPAHLCLDTSLAQEILGYRIRTLNEVRESNHDKNFLEFR